MSLTIPKMNEKRNEPPQIKGADVRFPPPLIYLIALAAGVAVNYSDAALPLLPETPLVRAVVGSALVMLGIGAIIMSFRDFRRTNQDPKPWEPTPEIIDTGIYSRSRNPMYVGMALLQTGIGILLANLWIVALVPVSLALNYVIAVRPEETYLEGLFGEPYLAYKRRVRRWI